MLNMNFVRIVESTSSDLNVMEWSWPCSLCKVHQQARPNRSIVHSIVLNKFYVLGLNPKEILRRLGHVKPMLILYS
jgi:hypothetical protein